MLFRSLPALLILLRLFSTLGQPKQARRRNPPVTMASRWMPRLGSRSDLGLASSSISHLCHLPLSALQKSSQGYIALWQLSSLFGRPTVKEAKIAMRLPAVSCNRHCCVLLIWCLSAYGMALEHSPSAQRQLALWQETMPVYGM